MSNVEQQRDFTQISVIVPVKNEAASIRQLLQGLYEQTYQPSEIVITDGGSTDNTREIIRELQSSSGIPVVLIATDHALPGRGRNLAIARATNEWIASIDAGTKPKPDWLAQLVMVAKRDSHAEVIYGVAQPLLDSYFTECAAIAYVPGGRITKSIASCLLHRKAWLKVEGFREDLRSGEDLLFFRSLAEASVPSTKCSEAVVIWELSPTFASTFRRFMVYSRNGMRAGLASEWQRNVTALYLLMLISVVGAIWFWPLVLISPAILLLRAEKRILNWYRWRSPRRAWLELLSPRRILTVALINLVIDIATFCGMVQWFVHDRDTPAKEWQQERF